MAEPLLEPPALLMHSPLLAKARRLLIEGGPMELLHAADHLADHHPELALLLLAGATLKLRARSIEPQTARQLSL